MKKKFIFDNRNETIINSIKRRLYINITNYCSLGCPFCCMYSDKSKKTFMSFEIFQKIIEEEINKAPYNENFEVQLEGGEPTEHPDLALFLNYLAYTKRVLNVFIVTNGIKLVSSKFLLRRCIDVPNNSAYQNFCLVFRLSVNKSTLNKVTFEDLQNLDHTLRFMNRVGMFINARYETDEEKEYLEKNLKEMKLMEFNKTDIYQLQSYGKYFNKENLSKPIINQEREYWNLYSCDGHSFANDIIARSEYEKRLV